MDRYLKDQVIRDLKRKMVFLDGPPDSPYLT